MSRPITEGDALLLEALGWLSDIMAEDSTRDGEPPTSKDIGDWIENWIPRAQDWLYER
jgi:hypothetical protein